MVRTRRRAATPLARSHIRRYRDSAEDAICRRGKRLRTNPIIKQIFVGAVLLAGSVVTSSRASETCIASVYWEGFGRSLADGHRHSPDELLAAHRTLPLGSSAVVTNLVNGRSLVVAIDDRGPFVRNRCIDLSRGAARALGISGLGRVRVDPIPSASPKALGAASPEANKR